MGLAFCGIYVRTGNLFLAIGFHALANNPGPLLTGGEFLVPPTLFS
jgi:membrane protease YdiL (CAAX protease family)